MLPASDFKSSRRFMPYFPTIPRSSAMLSRWPVRRAVTLPRIG